MRYEDLDSWQLEVVRERIAAMHVYCRSLVERMEKRHFDCDDRLRLLAIEVQDKLHTMWVYRHYANDGIGS